MLGSKTFDICLLLTYGARGQRATSSGPPLNPRDSTFLSLLSQGNIPSVRKADIFLPNIQNKTTPLNFYKYVCKKFSNSPKKF